ncbi:MULTISPECIES: cation:proton antiporter [unclassified Paenarthrobacter]|uniref:cation:proton antiporter n=1 Tax=unclassified Paenarthrobacter TaxID=2634190 RepID=UPI003CEFB3FE
MFEAPSILFFAAGLAVLAAAVLPKLLLRMPLSMPMVFLGSGILAFALLPDLPDPDPVKYADFTMHLTEVCVIISLMGAGLALDRPFRWRGWSTTWRLLAIVMPLSIVVMTMLGLWVLGLGLASALLIGAALSPTDPVLASEVQVGKPADTETDPDEDEVRFALTSEAGLNDGLAFPFVYLAIAISLVGVTPEAVGQWAALDILWRMVAGVLVGFGTGKVLSRLFFASPIRSFRLSEHSEGFVALAATFLAYGATEMIEGYGFVAVFVCALTIRAAERHHSYHQVLHGYVEQLERLMTIVILVLLGGAIARGVLDGIGWAEVLVALVFLVLVRPAAGWLGLLGGKTGPRERLAISYFGIRGIGSLYYVAYALSHGNFDGDQHALWALVALVVALSVVVHGATTAPLMQRLDRLRADEARRKHGDESRAPHTAI